MPLLTKPISSIQLAEMLGLKHVGRNQKILHVSTLDNPKKNSLFFSKNGFVRPAAHSTCIAHGDIEARLNQSSLIVSENPRMDFIKSTNYLLKNGFVKTKSHDNFRGKDVIVHETAHIEEVFDWRQNAVSAGVIIKRGTKVETASCENAVLDAKVLV